MARLQRGWGGRLMPGWAFANTDPSFDTETILNERIGLFSQIENLNNITAFRSGPDVRN
jgi:hypothetical protein